MNMGVWADHSVNWVWSGHKLGSKEAISNKLMVQIRLGNEIRADKLSISQMARVGVDWWAWYKLMKNLLNTEWSVCFCEMDKQKANSSSSEKAINGQISPDLTSWTKRLLKKLKSLRWGPLCQSQRAKENGS